LFYNFNGDYVNKVYFVKEIDGKSLVKVFDALNVELKGNVAVKISTGEPGGNNFLNPLLIKDLVVKINGTIVECNTAYKGKRYDAKSHYEAAEKHGFTQVSKVDIMDEDGEVALVVKEGMHLQENYVGKNFLNYDSMLVLSHFKGHQMGGYGGALKNMSIGIASRNGKAWIHSGGVTKNPKTMWFKLPKQDVFLECMAEACKSVIDHLKPENIVYINVVNNLSIDCDCNAHPEKPCMADIGILASTDPVALDQACLDLIYQSNDEGKKRLIARIEKMNGPHILEHAESLKIGSRQYELVQI